MTPSRDHDRRAAPRDLRSQLSIDLAHVEWQLRTATLNRSTLLWKAEHLRAQLKALGDGT